MSAQKDDGKRCLKFPHALLCVALSVALFVSGLLPRTETFLDDFTQPEQAHAIPLALPLFGTLLAVVGIGVAGTSMSSYDANLVRALEAFCSSTGQTIESVSSQLQSAVGNDGMIALSMLSSGLIPNLLNWSKNLDMATVDSSALSGDYALNVPNASPLNVAFSSSLPSFIKRGTSYGDLHPDYSWLAYHYGSFDFDSYTVTSFMYCSNGVYTKDYVSLAPFNSDSWLICGYYPTVYGYDSSGVAKTSGGGIPQGVFVKNYPSFDKLILNSQFDIRVYDKPEYYANAQLIATCIDGVWSGVAVPENSYLDGALSGVLSGGVASGDITLDQLNPKIGIWNPTVGQLEAGYSHADVMEGVNAGSGEGGGDVGEGEDDGNIMNKILAALIALSGLANIPALLNGITTGFASVWDMFWAWCGDVYAWMQSLAQSLVGWWTGLLDWVGSLDLASWLAKVWDWICTLDLVGALQGILDAVINLPNFIWNGFTGLMSALFLPDSDHLQDLIDDLLRMLNDLFGIDINFGSIFGGERPIDGQDATFHFGGFTFSSTIFDPRALIEAVMAFRPYIRGFVALMLVYFSINEIFKLLGSAGIFSGHVHTLNDAGTVKGGS